MQTVVTSPEALKRAALPYRAWLGQARRCALAAWFPLALTAAVLVLYAPSIAYPVHWDDPSWYAQGQGMSLIELLRAVPTYQFYRPLTMHVARLLTTPGGVVRVVGAHVLQIGAHLAIALGVFVLALRMGLGCWPARLAALLFALHPFSFQAVAWQGAHQPLSTLAAVASVLAADAYAVGLRAGRRRVGLLLTSVAAYAAGLLLQESVLPLVWVFGWIALDAPRRTPLPRRERLWPLGHLALTCAYAAVWLSIPRTQEITGQGFQPIVLAYLLQGVAFPLGWPLVQVGAADWPVGMLLAALAAGAGLLVWAAARGTSRRIATLGALWVASSIAPVWAGLGWDYVSVGPRLFYAAAPGVALLFAAASPLTGRGGRRARAIWLALLVALPLAVCIRDGADQQRLAEAAFRHQSRAIDVMASRPG
ncbi:MAG: hypothetical protein GX649_17085, partial [Chloroflexi bacterium]|nr:hypothetical protein [Chloroflexota bacterium]